MSDPSYRCVVDLIHDKAIVKTTKRVGDTWKPLEPGEIIVLDKGESIEVWVGDGWEDDAYVWRLHPYAPNDRGKGPRYSGGQGVWQCDCSKARGVNDPLLSKLYKVAPPAVPTNASHKEKHDARPWYVTLTDDESLPPHELKDDHWLTGRIAWGEKPDDPCRHGPGERKNRPFDPEMENKSGSPPTCQIRIRRRRRRRARSRRSSR